MARRAVSSFVVLVADALPLVPLSAFVAHEVVGTAIREGGGAWGAEGEEGYPFLLASAATLAFPVGRCLAAEYERKGGRLVVRDVLLLRPFLVLFVAALAAASVGEIVRFCVHFSFASAILFFVYAYDAFGGTVPRGAARIREWDYFPVECTFYASFRTIVFWAATRKAGLPPRVSRLAVFLLGATHTAAMALPSSPSPSSFFYSFDVGGSSRPFLAYALLKSFVLLSLPVVEDHLLLS